ncbi:hypothetical protein F5888DRAFT_1635117 [Russula emetica]|nr:hypothetical protein F5888DRAFT_1635117 [Russula emetica]
MSQDLCSFEIWPHIYLADIFTFAGVGILLSLRASFVGRTDMEDVLKKLDKLTHEEARMAVAQNSRATHNADQGVANTVVAVGDRVADVDDRVAAVNNKVACVDGKVTSVDDRVKVFGDKVAEVIHGA